MFPHTMRDRDSTAAWVNVVSNMEGALFEEKGIIVS